MKKKIDRLPAKVSQLGVRISMERNGARLISPSHIKFSGLMPASMLGGKAGKGRGRSCWRWRRKRSRASDGTTCATPPPPPPPPLTAPYGGCRIHYKGAQGRVVTAPPPSALGAGCSPMLAEDRNVSKRDMFLLQSSRRAFWCTGRYSTGRASCVAVVP